MSRWRVFEGDGALCGDLRVVRESDLLLKIFSRLDLKDLVRLRSVCKSWHDAIRSPRFLELYKEQPLTDEPWAALTSRAADNQFLYALLQSKLWLPRPAQITPWEFPQLRGLCSSGGLVCGVAEHRCPVLVVFNPITRDFKYLPPLDPVVILDAFMETDADSSYTIVVMHRDGNQVRTLHYESTTGFWRAGGGAVSLENLKAEVRRPLLGSACYLDQDPGVHYMLAYDIQSEAWSCAYIEYPEEEYVEYLSAFKYLDKYYCAAFATMNQSPSCAVVTGAAIWELRVSEIDPEVNVRDCVLVSEYPNTESGNILGVDPLEMQHVSAKLVGDTVVISGHYKYLWQFGNLSQTRFFGLWSPVAYNFGRGEWCSLENEDDDMVKEVDVECNYAFLPSFTARP